MKMVKHCHEESAGTYKLAQGALLGLVVDNRLEITNCFGFPKNCDESVNEGKLFYTTFFSVIKSSFIEIVALW